MPVKWNVFSGKERKQNKTHNDSDNISSDSIRGIVNHEISNASARTQIMNYFENMEVQNIRTEAILNEIRDAVTDSLEKIEQAASNESGNNDKLEEINKAVKKVSRISENLEMAIHKDNLLCYKNIKNELEQMENNNGLRARKLKNGIIFGIIISLLTLVAVGYLIARMYI